MTPSPGGEIAVDVVIDNYNYGRFLGEAIESACGQTHPTVNVVVVDDGSTDDSREVLRGYGSRVTTVLKENGGQASAFNAAIDHCAGDVVMLLDADDVLKPEAAARVAGAFALDPKLARVQYRMDVIDADGTPTGEVKPFQHLPMPSGDMRRQELDYNFDLGWMPTSANAFRAEVLRRILPIPEDSFRILADWYLVHLSTLLGPIRSLEQICASYRVHGGNSFEHEEVELDLDHVRRSVRLAQPTLQALLELAEELGLEHPRRLTSIADLGNRLISLKLAPDQHPLPEDRVGSLLAQAGRTIPRRRDVSLGMKAMYAGWFAAMAAAPRRQAESLALVFLFPERRRSMNRLLGRLHRD